jgi:hypothetical protein
VSDAIAHIDEQKQKNLEAAIAAGVAHLAEAILMELELELPKLGGIAEQMLRSGLRRVAFYELALALLLETGSATSVAPTLAV